MKTKQRIRIFGCLLLLIMARGSFAQLPPSKVLPPVIITGSNIKESILSSVQNSFGDANNIRWYQINRRYLVKFNSADMLHHAYYKHNGQFISHISYGFEKNLPLSVAQMIKARYPDYNVSRTFNVNENIWIANLENVESLVAVRIMKGKLSELDRCKNLTVNAPVLTSQKRIKR